MEKNTYNYKNGSITIKVAPIGKKFQAEINWDFGPHLKNESEISTLNEKGNYFQIQQLEIKKCIKSLSKIKNKRPKTKELIASLIHLHQEISKKMYYQQSLF